MVELEVSSSGYRDIQAVLAVFSKLIQYKMEWFTAIMDARTHIHPSYEIKAYRRLSPMAIPSLELNTTISLS